MRRVAQPTRRSRSWRPARTRRTRLLAHELSVAAHGEARQLLAAPLGGSYRLSQSSFLSSLRRAVVLSLAVLAVRRRCENATTRSARAAATHRRAAHRGRPACPPRHRLRQPCRRNAAPLSACRGAATARQPGGQRPAATRAASGAEEGVLGKPVPALLAPRAPPSARWRSGVQQAVCSSRRGSSACAVAGKHHISGSGSHSPRRARLELAPRGLVVRRVLLGSAMRLRRALSALRSRLARSRRLLRSGLR